MRPSTVLTGFAAFYLGMVLLKDGTIPTIVNDAARGLGDFARGIRPITQVG